MRTVVVTGSAGLIGSETVKRFAGEGARVIGIDNDMREKFFGPEASTKKTRDDLIANVRGYEHHDLDIRDAAAMNELFKQHRGAINAIAHTASQPSHDWAARDPQTDFAVNANGTLNLLEAAKQFSPQAPFIFTSTNKVYGDTPNRLPLRELAKRWEIEPGHEYEPGISETMSIDSSKHSLFGVSKAAADLLVQEYGRYFEMPTVVFRGGCLTGPGHAGTELQGFLSYLMICAVSDVRIACLDTRGNKCVTTFTASIWSKRSYSSSVPPTSAKFITLAAAGSVIARSSKPLICARRLADAN